MQTFLLFITLLSVSVSCQQFNDTDLAIVDVSNSANYVSFDVQEDYASINYVNQAAPRSYQFPVGSGTLVVTDSGILRLPSGGSGIATLGGQNGTAVVANSLLSERSSFILTIQDSVPSSKPAGFAYVQERDLENGSFTITCSANEIYRIENDEFVNACNGISVFYVIINPATTL